ncbi:MAG: GNAT family N-acetyltransferase [Ruminococcaceae bacterium]|nr:GNAT family N-acetyltransferase [Oscillospiraceae bacterium]
MIKEIKAFEEISGEISPLFPRIFSAFKYKSGSDNAWVQIDATGQRVSLLSSVDNNFTLIATEKSDFEEIKEFLVFHHFNSVLSNVPLKSTTEKACSLFKFTDIDIQKSNESFLILNSEASLNEYRSFHSLLFYDTDNSFDDWYYNFSKRIVKNDAKAVALKQHEVLLSTATAPMIFENSAIISGVYTLKGFRKKGYSKATIYKLIEELKKDNVTDIYLWCEKEVEEFYNKIGFEIIGNVYIETEL